MNNYPKKYKWFLEVSGSEIFVVVEEKVINLELIQEVLDYILLYHEKTELVIIATYMYVEKIEMLDEEYLELKNSVNNRYEQHYGFSIIIN